MNVFIRDPVAYVIQVHWIIALVLRATLRVRQSLIKFDPSEFIPPKHAGMTIALYFCRVEQATRFHQISRQWWIHFV